ncbi:MAG TPA: VWA domain-containing protein [Gemmatimonadota bacterium]|nr:VWA domain-containing protein [Gemmatimonadota bacterium]
MTGFLQPAMLLALPIALIPLVLAWRGRRTGETLRFSSLYLLERARRVPVRWMPTRSRWVLLIRVLILVLLVLAAARPVGPGGGDPAAHYPTRAVVAVDVSASAGQGVDGATAWEAIRGRADTLLSWTDGDDELALAAFADGLAGWWEGSPAALRSRLARLRPSARASDWPAAMTAVAGRIEEDTETYWLTDGARGARPPEGAAAFQAGHHVVWAWRGPAGPNRSLTAAERVAPGTVALAGSAWGFGAPAAAVVGRRIGGRLVDLQPLALDGSAAPAVWAAGDTATFAFRDADRLPADDRLYVAAPGGGESYRAARWAPPDAPPEPGGLFWEAALDAASPGAVVERVRSLDALVRARPDLALLPIRAYRPEEAALLAELAGGGTRLLFAPACADPACVPSGDWLPAAALPVPRLEWWLGDAGRQTVLLGRPRPDRGAGRGAGSGGENSAAGNGVAAVPDHLLARAPVRGALETAGGPEPEWTWDLATGEPALWVSGAVALWLVPLGPPVTRLGTTPLFPLVADAALAAWDPRWRRGGGGVRPGEPLAIPATGASVTGPLHAGDAARTWEVAAGGAPPRPEEAGLYRIEPRGAAGEPIYVAVNGDPAEGDLTPIPDAAWRMAGLRPIDGPGWREAAFPRRRGPELWPWALALALLCLATEAYLRRAG